MARGGKIGMVTRIATVKSWFESLPSQIKKKKAEQKKTDSLKKRR